MGERLSKQREADRLPLHYSANDKHVTPYNNIESPTLL